jgi:hypothetical protein
MCLLFVNQLMLSQVAFHAEPLFARLALMRPICAVHANDVFLQVGVCVEGAVTRLTDLVLDRLLVDLFRQGVYRHVAPHAGELRECLSAHLACMRLLPRMRPHVALHAPLLRELRVAYRAGEELLPRVHRRVR